jgi:membrane-associated protease RseP (regulator of RpoE activity)
VARRLVHFWIVWSVLLLVHEGGHALVALRQGLDPERITVGVGPALWRGGPADAQFVLRLLPLAGLTEVRDPDAALNGASHIRGWAEWTRHGGVLSGGVLATLTLVSVLAGVVATWERALRRRCLWGRIVIADALVLSVFNLLPVPPLDGGRAMLSAVSAWRGAALSADALFWLQVGGFAVAVVPMALWTSWTSRIDGFALRWRAPKQDSRRP